MKVSIQDVSEITRRVQVELPEEKVNNHLEKAYRRLNRTVKVKGFRPGKVPLAILKRHYADQVKYDVGMELVNETLMAALEQTEIQAVSQSDLDTDPLQEGEPFRYSFLVEIRPEIVVQDYQNIPAKRQRLVVTDEEVAAELELRRQSNSYLKTLEESRPIQQGDHAVLDFKAFADGKPVPGGESKGFHLEVGASRFHPDFETQLLGTSKNESKEIVVPFPADHGNQHLAGKNVTFEVVVKDIKEKVLPELNDDFAKDLGEFDTLDELRTSVRAELERKRKSHIDAEVGTQILEELINRNPFEVPRSMVEQELQRMLDTIRFRLSAQKLTLEQVGMDEETFRERNRDIAEKRVRKSILLDKIAAQEEFEITDADLDMGLYRAAEEAKEPYEKVKSFYQRNNLIEQYRHQLREEKVMRFLQDKAEVTEADTSPANSDEQ
jgi:trigger factor